MHDDVCSFLSHPSTYLLLLPHMHREAASNPNLTSCENRSVPTPRAGSHVLTCRLLRLQCSCSGCRVQLHSQQQKKLPTWQQNTSTDKAFYYFYSTSSPQQLWRNASRTWNDARMRSAAVSLSAGMKMKMMLLHLHPRTTANHKLSLISSPAARRYLRPG